MCTKYQVQRVPNDGDCFFSSIKAALPAGMAIDRARGFVSGDAATATEAGAVAGKELTVAEMREWVAEEAGQEQLEFYILQAGANPMDRWWAGTVYTKSRCRGQRSRFMLYRFVFRQYFLEVPGLLFRGAAACIDVCRGSFVDVLGFVF